MNYPDRSLEIKNQLADLSQKMASLYELEQKESNKHLFAIFKTWLGLDSAEIKAKSPEIKHAMVDQILNAPELIDTCQQSVVKV